MNKAELLEIPVSKLRVNPHQPRTHFNQSELQELAASILEVGIIQPPLVRPLPDAGCYEIIAGERRFRAAQLAGLKTITVCVRESDDLHSAQAALIENVQRKDLNAIEIAQALQKLVDSYHFNQEALAAKIGKQRSTVANYLRLLSLPQTIQESVIQGRITTGHAKAILSLPETEQQNQLHEIVLRDDLTVRQTEYAASKILKRKKKAPPVFEQRDFYLDAIAEKIQIRLGSKVQLYSLGEKKGRICIEYYDWDDLERLMNLLGVEGD